MVCGQARDSALFKHKSIMALINLGQCASNHIMIIKQYHYFVNKEKAYEIWMLDMSEQKILHPISLS